jgi:hypothetical protein
MSIQVPHTAQNFLTSCVIDDFSRTLFHGVKIFKTIKESIFMTLQYYLLTTVSGANEHKDQ